MKVYACFENTYDYCNVWENLVKIVSTKEKAEEWLAEVKPNKFEWRSFEEKEVE